MESLAVLLGIAIVGYLLIAPALGIAAYTRGGRLRDEIARLRRQIEGLTLQIDDLRRSGREQRTSPSSEAQVRTAPKPQAPRPQDWPKVTDAVVPSTPSKSEPAPPHPQPTPQNAAPTPPRPQPAVTAKPAIAAQAPVRTKPEAAERDAAAAWRHLEESITSRWLVWLGGVTLALAGAFLVKYSIDRGWLGPAVRVTFAFVMGLILIGAGEWLRRQPLQRAIAALRPNYVPPALTAAGLFTAFASVYAAYALYALIAPIVAFVLLAAIALGAVVLALVQGPLIAALGLLGAFATPLLVSTTAPSPWALFGYLLVVVAASLMVVRRTAWWWLVWSSLTGAALWPLFWLLGQWTPGDAMPIGAYLLLLFGMFIAVQYGQAPSGAQVTLTNWFEPLAMPERVVWGAALTVALLIGVLVRTDDYGLISLVTLAVLVVLYLSLGYREAAYDGLPLVAAALCILLMFFWPGSASQLRAEEAFLGFGTALRMISPTGSAAHGGLFILMSLVLAILFGLGGFVSLRGVKRPSIWAGISAAVPVLLLAIAYWRITDLAVDLRWSAIALLLSALGGSAAAWVYRDHKLRAHDWALGAYAAASVASLSLAAAMVLEQAWLTVALSLQLPALAWIHDRFSVKSLRPIALVVAAVVLLRLVLNYHILDYPLGSVPGINWLLYGYGIPAAAFWLAGHRFRRRADDLLVMVLEAGTVGLVALLITLEIRSLMAGSLAGPGYRLDEQSIQSIAWLALAYGCMIQFERHSRAVMWWAWRILAGLAAGQVLLPQTILFNPLWSGDPVGMWPVLNLLLFAYLVPAGFAYLFARRLARAKQTPYAIGSALAGCVLLFVYVSLELRHLYHGSVLSRGSTGLTEIYSYALAWLSLAYGWLLWRRWDGNVAFCWAWRGLAGFAAAQVLLVHLLLVNPLWTGDPVGAWPVLNLLFLAYLAPAAFALLFARELERTGWARTALAAALAGFGLVFVYVSLEVRHAYHGPVLTQGSTGLAEICSYTLAWSSLAYVWLLWHGRSGGVALLWAWRGLAGLVAAQVLLVHLLYANPLLSGDPVGSWPVLNLLLLAYLVPAAFAFLFAHEFHRTGQTRLAGGAALGGLALVFVYVSMEVRHLFHGSVLSHGPTGDAEMYSYSLAWLCYALALLALGITKRIASLRYASLAMLLITVGKVFLIDMSALTGLYRVASFFGLGLSLIGIGYVYARFVFPPRGPGAGQVTGRPAAMS